MRKDSATSLHVLNQLIAKAFLHKYLILKLVWTSAFQSVRLRFQSNDSSSIKTLTMYDDVLIVNILVIN